MMERIPQILPYAPHTEDGILRSIMTGGHPSKIFLSADLTRATDGFGHDAIGAVIDGLRKAGLPSFLCTAARESLGLGDQPHYVEYRLKQLDQTTADYCRKRGWVDEKAGTAVVPKLRGSLMGTPLSFCILSLLNHWMSEGLGRNRIICGDDLACLTHPTNISSYSERASAVGSELHQGKSFRSRIGFVFCEAYALLARGGASLEPFRPVSLKEFVRDGNGVMRQAGVDPSSFNRLRRCAKTIYREQRKFAAKKGRPAELPAALGGLGHPCKGRLRVPRRVREGLWELYLCENPAHGGARDPSKIVKTLVVPAVPASRTAWKRASGMIEDYLASKVINNDTVMPGDCFIPNKFVGAYRGMDTNMAYLATGNTYKKVFTHKIKPGKVLWPCPSEGCRRHSSGGVLSTHTRIATVLEWDRRARCEFGQYFPSDFSAHIRGRISAYRHWEMPGDVGC
jgi:hypothetical protein